MTSPLMLLGWIAVSARVSSFGAVVERSDPPGFDERLESWSLFVRASREVGMDHGFQERVARLETALSKMPLDPKPVPPIEFGATYNVDLRRPLYVAQMVVTREASDLLAQMVSGREMGHLGDVLGGSIALLQGTRCSDVVALLEANRRLRSLLETCNGAYRRLSDSELADLAARLIVMEERRVPIFEILRNDVALFANTVDTSNSDAALDALNLLRKAYKAVRAGHQFRSFRFEAARLKDSVLRDRVMSVLAAWDVVLKQEETNRRMILGLISELREEQILRQGLNPDEVPNRGVPASLLREGRFLAVR